LDDALVEGTESFTVIIENVVGADPLKSAGVVTIIDGGPGYDGWAVEQGLTENAGFSDDASGDGFANSFHYAMRVPATAFIPSEYPDLVPRMDTELFGNKAAFVFKIPVEARDDIILEADESFNLENWSVIASKEGGSEWVFEFPNVLILDSPVDGYRRVAVAATNTFAQPTPGFYRLNVRMR
jgi:hypothetical protein